MCARPPKRSASPPCPALFHFVLSAADSPLPEVVAAASSGSTMLKLARKALSSADKVFDLARSAIASRPACQVSGVYFPYKPCNAATLSGVYQEPKRYVFLPASGSFKYDVTSARRCAIAIFSPALSNQVLFPSLSTSYLYQVLSP